MATTQEFALGTVTTLLSTELNSLASSAGLTAGAISSVGGASGLFNNVTGGGGLGGYTLGQFELRLAAPAAHSPRDPGPSSGSSRRLTAPTTKMARRR